MKPPGPFACKAQSVQQAKKIIDMARVMFKSALAPRKSGRVMCSNPPLSFGMPQPIEPTPGISPNQLVKRMKMKMVQKNQNVFLTKSAPTMLSRKS